MAVKHKRKNIRFESEPGTLAGIDFITKTKAFKPNCYGLVLSESHKGCSLVLTHAPEVVAGDRCRVAVGALAPLLAEVRWVIALDEQILKVGFQFLE